ncbi:S53 family peptidase [Solimicrobium silvestre]|uniref:Peptidase S53 domain-containing protein n=1 Tax=Solimicrobium silvestre TaxID=2099400 RepID=A0A2S9H2D9_9BURK|nr:S53 family peptidase [Solimicrobium silvestre]PRC94113.1 hypothetical protein S2091_1286 [Solimicrobium silvestre]
MKEQFRMLKINFETMTPTKWLIVLASVVTLSACGGHSSSGGINVANAVLSKNQQIFESLEFSGGTYSVDWSFPYGGGNLVNGANYIASNSTGGLSKSPAIEGAQTQLPVVTSLDVNLQAPTFGPAVYLNGGQVITRSATAQRKVSYVGSNIQVDYIADDGVTVAQSTQFSNFSSVPLTGFMGSTANEFQASVPINNWISANNFSANAKWQPGSVYTKRQGTSVGDTYYVQNCQNFSNVVVTTATTSTVVCQAGGTIAQIFPIVQFDEGSGHPTEEEAYSDGTMTTVQGLPMWIANNPIPTTLLYRTYFQLDGNIYMGYMHKSGVAYHYDMNDGTTTDYLISMNQAAVNSIQQGIITGASVTGSQSGNTNSVSSIDLFGLGAHGINGALAPVDLLSHYNVPANLNGAGQTIVIIDAPGSANVLDDLNTYSQFFNLPQCNSANPCFQQIDLSNGAAVDPNNDWGIEVELDTQMVHAIAPQAKIILITANSSSSTDLSAAITYAASLPNVTAVTMSFGGSDNPPIVSATQIEPAEYLAEDTAFATAQANLGMIFFASSGDSGNYFYTTPGGFAYPASSPYVTAVGGTQINSLNWGLGSQSEIGWQFSGGGTSTGFALPNWQASYPAIASNNAYRAVPDVSAVADGQHSALSIYYKQQWVMVGGTSASSPIWAGFSALFGQYLGNKGQSLSTLIKNTSGGFNGLLYQSRITQGSNPGLTNITAGSNGFDLGCSVCSAGVGYNDVTGLGVPNMTNFLANF